MIERERGTETPLNQTGLLDFEFEMMGDKLIETQEMPPWLETLLTVRFFVPCSVHEGVKKNEKNILCLDCCSSFCTHCIPSHGPHRFLQIRRYVYHDVVRVEDLERLIDSAAIQSYLTNNARVVFINERTPTQKRSVYCKLCRTCDRGIQDNYLYCSLHCKVKCLLSSEGGLSNYLRDCEFLPAPNSSEFDEGHLSPDSILDATSSQSGSTASGAGGPAAALSTGGSGGFLVRRRRSSIVRGSDPANQSGSDCPSGSGSSGRRKGTPRRAPFN